MDQIHKYEYDLDALDDNNDYHGNYKDSDDHYNSFEEPEE